MPPSVAVEQRTTRAGPPRRWPRSRNLSLLACSTQKVGRVPGDAAEHTARPRLLRCNSRQTRLDRRSATQTQSRSATRPGDSVELRVLAPLVRGPQRIASRRHRSGRQDSLPKSCASTDARSRRQSGAGRPWPATASTTSSWVSRRCSDRGERRHPRSMLYGRGGAGRGEVARSSGPDGEPERHALPSMGAPATRRWTPAFFIQQPHGACSRLPRRGYLDESRRTAGHRRQSISCRGRHRAVEPPSWAASWRPPAVLKRAHVAGRVPLHKPVEHLTAPQTQRLFYGAPHFEGLVPWLEQAARRGGATLERQLAR